MYNIDICQELSQNFLDFSYEANSQRAFPDARDGLKPGQRACLWEMYQKGYSSSKPHVKSAKISGGVIAAWWPHSDAAIYETFARMSQPWINTIPEVDWHGGNGNQILGSRPASSRYTEARLSKASELGLFQGIKKNNVPMIFNFSEDDKWPEVLPAVLPRLMLNGSQGIGVTISNTWLCHNLKEISDVLNKYMSEGVLDYSNLYPDFPSGGIIVNKDEVHDIYKTGKGKVVLRAKTEIKGNSIFITEMPYQVYVEPYIESVKELIVKEELTNIEDILNKSDKKNGLLIEVVCSGNPKAVLDKLFTKTELQKSLNANQWALVGKTPKLLTLKDYCEIYVSHNIECLKREINFDLEKTKKRLHIVNGLLIALEDIDNIISLIKNSESSLKAKENLILKYSLDEEQAKSILAMKLSNLARLEKVELEREQKELMFVINENEDILSNRNSQISIILERLNNLNKIYGTERKTKLTNINFNLSKEEKEIVNVEPENCVVIMSENGLIKRIPAASFKAQRRNGAGVKTQDSITTSIIRTNTIDSLMVFTDKGRMYRILVDDIPSGTNSSKGTPIKELIQMESFEKPTLIYSIYYDTDAKYILFTTKNGVVKKTSLDEYTSTRKKSGVEAIKFRDNDYLVSVNLIKDEPIMIITKQGMAIKFNSSEISPTGRSTIGMKGINLNKEDEVIAVLPIRDADDDLAVFSENGLGKRVKLSEFVLQGRGGKGIVCYKPTGNTGRLVSACLCKDGDTLFISGNNKGICIQSSELSTLGRSSIGVSVIKEGRVTRVSKV